jgi:N-acetylglucosaminyldiphosphoundecaprenol N-acetyl-beta-D-mannosaminyltransferase
MYIRDIQHKIFDQPLSELPDDKILISTLNAYSFGILQKDKLFQNAIHKSHLILSDGISIVWAMRFLTGRKLKKVAGADLFSWEMDRLQGIKGKCFFLGSSNNTLGKIYNRVKLNYPDVQAQYYEPPFKSKFNEEDSKAMINAVNSFAPDVLFIGMSAPKQENWAALHFDQLDTKHICCIGAVFDFFAMTVRRAPKFLIRLGLEWFYRLIREPKRNWRRYIFGNPFFVRLILKEKVQMIREQYFN